MGRTDSYYFPHHQDQHDGQGSSIHHLRNPAAHWTNAYRGVNASPEEKERFVPSTPTTSVISGCGPVTLTPGWEDTSPPPFDDILKNNSILNLRAPPDRYKIVYLILVIHGIGTLMPWNMFITAKEYFEDYKLNPEFIGNETNYRGSFLTTIGFAAQVPNVFFNWLNIFVQMGGNLKVRIVWSIIIEALLFIATVALAMVDTFSIADIFYYLTIASVVIINMAGGIYQNSVYGIAAKMGYAGAVVLGSNISGTFASLISIGAKYFAPSRRTSAIYYFITALFVLFVCFDTFFALPLNKFYRYHEAQSAKEEENKRQIASQMGRSPRTPYGLIIKKCWPQLLNVFFVFFVTLAIFPAIHSDVKQYDPNFYVNEDYYTHILCFLTFNVSAMFGSLFASIVMWPGPKYLWIPVFLRAGLIPFFLFCNYQPHSYDRILEVYITNDWVFWGGGTLMGFTSGYFSSLAMTYGPRAVEPRDAPIAGMFGAACLITGIFVGILFQYIPPIIVSSFKISGNDTIAAA